jgi:CRP/FNR family transcriptional regulator
MIKDKLKNIPLFKNLSNVEIEKVIDISLVKKLSRDNILFYEGDSPEYFYVLIQGCVKFYKTDLKGNELVLHYFSQPTTMAFMPSFDNINFPATSIVTRDETEVLLLNRSKFIKLLESDLSFSVSIIKTLTKKIKELEEVINRNLIYDAMTKVCAYIKENPKDVLNIKHKEIATILNMAPETLSRILKKLKILNIIDTECRLMNKEKLEMLLEF